MPVLQKTTGKIEPLGSSLSKNRFPVRGHVINTTPTTTRNRTCKYRCPLAGFLSGKWREISVHRFVVGVGIHPIFPISGTNHRCTRILWTKVHANANISHDTVTPEQFTRLA